MLADGQEPRNSDSSDDVLLSLAHPVTAVEPNKEHSDEVHLPPTHSVAADVQELPSDDYAEEVYLSHMPPTATNAQEPHTSDEVNPLLTPCDMQGLPRGHSEEITHPISTRTRKRIKSRERRIEEDEAYLTLCVLYILLTILGITCIILCPNIVIAACYQFVVMY